MALDRSDLPGVITTFIGLDPFSAVTQPPLAACARAAAAEAWHVLSWGPSGPT